MPALFYLAVVLLAIGLVTNLLAFDAQPVTDLQNQITTEKNQQTALLDLSTKLLALQNDAESLSSSSVLSARQATSSNPAAVSATAGSSTPLASYLVTPIAQAQTQQLLSNGFSDSTTALVGAGTITIKRGGFVNSPTPLAQLNGGNGVARGDITITDRSGASATMRRSPSSFESRMRSGLRSSRSRESAGSRSPWPVE